MERVDVPNGILLQFVAGITLVAHRGEVLEIDGVERGGALGQEVVIGFSSAAMLTLDVAVATIGALAFVVLGHKGIVVGTDLRGSTGHSFQVDHIGIKTRAKRF